MGYINQPFDLKIWSDDFNARLRKLETAVRFTAPDVSTVPTYPRTGDIVYNNTGNYVEYWNGTAWVIFGDNNVGSPKVAFNSTWSGTGLTYTGTPATGYYIKIGKSVFFTITVLCTNVTAFGTGDYSLTLPFVSDGHYILQNGGVHKTSTGNHYSIAGDLETGSSAINLYYNTSNGSMNRMKYNQPIALSTTDYFYVSGSYFVP